MREISRHLTGGAPVEKKESDGNGGFYAPSQGGEQMSQMGEGNSQWLV